MKNIIVRLIMFCTLLASFTHANEQGTFLALGTGLLSCGKYINSPKEGNDRSLINQWIFGYLSSKSESAHHNYSDQEKGYLDHIDADAITNHIELYCKKNPIETIYTAVNLLNYELFQRHVKGKAK